MLVTIRWLLIALSLLVTLRRAGAQGTAFTYQGSLTDRGKPASGLYDFSFRLAADAQGNTFITPALEVSGQPATNGLFTATLDFGAGPFNGSNIWLQVGVRTNGSNGGYTYLTPLSALTPVPYAVTAAKLASVLPASQLSGPLQSGQLSGAYSNAVTFTNGANSFAGNGSGLTNIQASSVAGFWTNSYTNTLIGIVAGVSRHPALGFNSWFCCSDYINQTNMLAKATNMIQNGMYDVGYRYFNLDEGWQGTSRDSNGWAVWSTNFPMGPTNWFNTLHAMGLLGGIYGPGQNTPGYIGHTEQFTNLFADGQSYGYWGVDYVKNDGGFDRLSCEQFLLGFLSTGRVPYYNATGFPLQPWMVNELSSCRVAEGLTVDLTPGNWAYFTNRVYVLSLPKWANQSGYAHSHWNDPDAFDVSTYTKQEMSLFSILQCQLLADDVPPPGNNALFYLTNSEVLAIDQDDLAIPGTVVGTSSDGYAQVWVKPVNSVNSGIKAVCLFNQNLSQSETVTCTWSQIDLPAGPALVRDLWFHSYLGYYTNSYSVTLQPGDVQLLIIRAGAPPFLQTGTNYIAAMWPMGGWTNSSSTMSGPLVHGLYFGNSGRYAWFPGDTWTGNAINGVTVTNSIMVSGFSSLSFCLAGQATRFHAAVGPCGSCGASATNDFQVWLDGVLIGDSGLVKPNSPAYVFDLDLTGGQILTLVETNWGNANGLNSWALWGSPSVYVPDKSSTLYGVSGLDDSQGNNRVLLDSSGTRFTDQNGANSFADSGTSIQISTAAKPVIIAGNLQVNGNQTNLGGFTVVNGNLAAVHFLGYTNSGYPFVSALGAGLGTGGTNAFVTNDVAITDNDFNVVLGFSGTVPASSPVAVIKFAQPWPNNVKPNCFLTLANAQAVNTPGGHSLFIDPSQTTTNQIVIMSGSNPPSPGVTEVSCHCRGSN